MKSKFFWVVFVGSPRWKFEEKKKQQQTTNRFYACQVQSQYLFVFQMVDWNVVFVFDVGYVLREKPCYLSKRIYDWLVLVHPVEWFVGSIENHFAAGVAQYALIVQVVQVDARDGRVNAKVRRMGSLLFFVDVECIRIRVESVETIFASWQQLCLVSQANRANSTQKSLTWGGLRGQKTENHNAVKIRFPSRAIRFQVHTRRYCVNSKP